MTDGHLDPYADEISERYAGETIGGWSEDYAAICETYEDEPDQVAKWLKENPAHG